MATSTLLQRLPSAGDITFTDIAESHRRQVETFIANGTIAKGEVVMFDATKTGPERVIYVIKAALQANGQGLACGVALAAATAGQRIDVIVGGYAESVASNGAMALANRLTAAGTVAGQVDGRVAGDLSPAFGVSLEAAANPDCWIYKQF